MQMKLKTTVSFFLSIQLLYLISVNSITKLKTTFQSSLKNKERVGDRLPFRQRHLIILLTQSQSKAIHKISRFIAHQSIKAEVVCT